jgi:hypothetical protein
MMAIPRFAQITRLLLVGVLAIWSIGAACDRRGRNPGIDNEPVRTWPLDARPDVPVRPDVLSEAGRDTQVSSERVEDRGSGSHDLGVDSPPDLNVIDRRTEDTAGFEIEAWPGGNPTGGAVLVGVGQAESIGRAEIGGVPADLRIVNSNNVQIMVPPISQGPSNIVLFRKDGQGSKPVAFNVLSEYSPDGDRPRSDTIIVVESPSLGFELPPIANQWTNEYPKDGYATNHETRYFFGEVLEDSEGATFVSAAPCQTFISGRYDKGTTRLRFVIQDLDEDPSCDPGTPPAPDAGRPDGGLGPPESYVGLFSRTDSENVLRLVLFPDGAGGRQVVLINCEGASEEAREKEGCPP